MRRDGPAIPSASVLGEAIRGRTPARSPGESGPVDAQRRRVRSVRGARPGRGRRPAGPVARRTRPRGRRTGPGRGGGGRRAAVARPARGKAAAGRAPRGGVRGVRRAATSAGVAAAGAALELFQAYLLVHDDWMDGDDVRRGGPSVPAMMRARLRGHERRRERPRRGPRGGVVAARRSSSSRCRPSASSARRGSSPASSEEVIQGQVLDVRSRGARRARTSRRVHALKTASYTVRAPVVMGAMLAGATDAQRRRRWRRTPVRSAWPSSCATTSSGRSATRARRASRRGGDLADGQAHARSSSTRRAIRARPQALARVLGRARRERRGPRGGDGGGRGVAARGRASRTRIAALVARGARGARPGGADGRGARAARARPSWRSPSGSTE